MMTYLEGGWYDSEQKLRTEVIDGAVDAAGLLLRAGVQPPLLTRLALRTRALVAITSRGGLGPYDAHDRRALEERLGELSDRIPELYSFVRDCLEQVQGPTDLLAFYLHLVHVNQMLQLLQQVAPRKRTSKKPTKKAKRKAAKATKRPAKKTKRKAAKPTKKKTAGKKAKRKTKAAKKSPRGKKQSTAKRTKAAKTKTRTGKKKAKSRRTVRKSPKR